MKGKLLIVLIVLSSLLAFGTTLNLVSEVGVHTDAWKSVMGTFEEETGIDLEIEQFPYANYLDQLMLTYTSGRVDFDIPYISMLWYPSLSLSNYIYPINEIPGHENLNLEDVPGINNAIQNENLYIVPYMNELGGVIYRKDLFENPEEKANFREKYGYELNPPTTLEEYRDIAEFFYRPPELYGITLMGKRSIFLATHFMQRLWANGGNLLDDDMKPIFNSEAGVEALEDLMVMFDYANPASKNYDFQDAVNEFIAGRSAMVEIWTTGLLYVDDPEKSSVVGKGSFAGFPRPESRLGEKLPMLYICWGFSVSSAAEDKDAVLKWLEFVTSTENEVKAAPIGNIPARFSALASEELQSEFEWMKDFSATMENCIPTPIVPLIPEGGSIVSGFIAPATSEFITGLKSAKDVLDNAVKGVYELMEENGYYD